MQEAGMEKLLSHPWEPDLETGSRPAVPPMGQHGAGWGSGVGEGPAHWSPPSQELVFRGKQRLPRAYAPGISILDGHLAPAKENTVVPGRPGTSFHRQSKGEGRSWHRSPAHWDGGSLGALHLLTGLCRPPRNPVPSGAPGRRDSQGAEGRPAGQPAGGKSCSFSLGRGHNPPILS